MRYFSKKFLLGIMPMLCVASAMDEQCDTTDNGAKKGSIQKKHDYLDKVEKETPSKGVITNSDGGASSNSTSNSNTCCIY